jgi:WD40 repeat protein
MYRMLHVLDVNEGKVLRSFVHGHDKNLSYIALSTPSPHVPLPRDSHNVFLTTAPDNAVLMWDLRQATTVLRYTNHVNRREAIQVAFSPCMRFFATGSEDKTCRIFDITAGKDVQRLTGHRDVVSAVAFNPLFAQLATGSYDGTVKFYCDPTVPLYG